MSVRPSCEAPASPRAGAAAPGRRPRRVRRLLLAAPAIAAAAGLLALGGARGLRALEARRAQEARRALFAPLLAAGRPFPFRLGLPEADVYRPRDPLRSGERREVVLIPPAPLAALHARGELHAVATAFALGGELGQAEALLAQAATRDPTADARLLASDQAALAVARGALEPGLHGLAALLAAAPAHPQALWNRAHALDRLGLPLSAAASFERVAALGEPGWGDEARAEARRLGVARGAVARWRAGERAGRALALERRPLPLDEAQARPDLARFWLYEAVRTGTRAEEVRALRPLAAALDAHYGGGVLGGLVDRVARADFGRRGPLARRYLERLRAGSFELAADDPLLAAGAAAGAADLAIGALVRSKRAQDDPARFGALARAQGDPWFDLLAAEIEASSAQRRQRHRAADAVARAALDRCAGSRLVLRCLSLRWQRASALVGQFEAAQAAKLVQETLARAWTEAPPVVPKLLRSAAEVHRRTLRPALAEVYQGEAALVDLALRDGERGAGRPSCRARDELEDRAETAISRLQYAAARAHLAEIVPCGGPELSTTGVRVLATLRDAGLAGGFERRVEEAARLLDLRLPQASPIGKVLIDVAIGAWRLGVDPAAGRARLDRAAAALGALPAADAQTPQAALMRRELHARLALDAARRGAFGEALALVGRDAGVDAAAPCTLALAALHHRAAVVARGPSGAIRGAADDGLVPIAEKLARLGAAVAPAFDGCPEVRVVAPGKLRDHTRHLPTSIAWSYRLPAPAAPPARMAPPAPAAPPGPVAAPPGPVRLVVADVEPPAGLELPRLLWAPGAAPGVWSLRGAEATPGRVTAALPAADLVELHAHGLVDVDRSETPALALSPDAGDEGRFLLTAADIRRVALPRRPIVFLAACELAKRTVGYHDAAALPGAFVAVGARAVFAAGTKIPDRGASAFFEALGAELSRGKSPAIALRDVRVSFLTRPAGAWASDIVAFQP